MANEAHKEPTMEEILSSIRKIISEDDVAVDEPATAVENVTDIAAEPAVNDDFGNDVIDDTDLNFDDDFEEEDIFETEADFEDETSFEDSIEFEVTSDIDDDTFDEVPDFSDVSEPVSEPEPVVFAEPEPEPMPVAEPAPAPVAAAPIPDPVPTPAPQELAVPKTASLPNSALTDDSTADAAAGALGKLISNMDLGGENTIDALVRELLKPMMKEWLDANLQSIVEAKVEAEVARIARMAR